MQRQAIGALAPMIAEVVERHSRHLDRNDPVDVSQTTKSMCSEIASRFVFGCYNQTRTDQLLELLREAHHYSMRESRAWIRWPQWMPLSRRKYRARAEQKLDQWLAPIVAERLKEPGDNLLSIILRARGSEAVTAQALRGPILMLFLASFEPVSVTLSWALQLLAAHPQVQDRVADEAAGVLKGRPPADEDLPRLPYLQDVIKEVQRLYPNEWLITRRVLGSDRLPSGVLVRRGQEVMISPYLLGRDGRYFPDPSRFDPSRFTGTPTWPRAAYIPFGTGPRVCLGESFAKLQMAIALAAFLQRWRIEPVAGEPPRPATANLFSAYVQGGRLNLRFRARENHAAATKSLGR
jgi:cytochrome P450